MPQTAHETRFRHALELLKIVEGALAADQGKVVAYTEQLAAKLENEGDERLAARFRRVLRSMKTAELNPSQVALAKLPVDSESRLALADEELVAPSESGVVLSPEAQVDLEEFLNFVRQSDRLFAEGVGVSPSLLLSGPPGCGKTEAARFVAAELDLPLITARTDALISSFLGSTAKNIRLLFEHAARRPCILFLDEFDAVAKLRDDKHELGELKRVVVSLLQNIDALDGKTVLVAATNHPHLLDPAVWRRFSVRIDLGLPTYNARSELFRRFLGGFVGDAEVDAYAAVSEGLTGADIRRIAEDAKRTAVLESTRYATEEDVLWRVIRARNPEMNRDKEGLPEKLNSVKALSPKIFTVRRLARVFGCSVGFVSKNLGKGASA